MKKALILSLIMVMVLTMSAFAGPLIGLQVAPAVNSQVALTVGWDFGYASIEGSKTNYNTWWGDWSIAGLWTPSDQAFSYRLGPKLIWGWNKNTGTLTYKDLAIVIGVSKQWKAFELFGEFDIGSSGALSIKPLIGFNILFSGFFPMPVQPQTQ